MTYKTNRQYRSMALLMPTDYRLLESDHYVEGYATTFDEPYLLYEYEGNKYFEVIAREALLEADLSDVIMQYDHEGKVLARLSNNTLALVSDEHGLKIGADLSKSVAAREMHDEIINGLVTKMSWAFTVTEDSYNKETRTNTISKIRKVYDVSAVSYPANSDTEISARSWLDGVIEAEKREALEQQAALKLAQAKYFYYGERN